jgi:hypothetical protein
MFCFSNSIFLALAFFAASSPRFASASMDREEFGRMLTGIELNGCITGTNCCYGGEDACKNMANLGGTANIHPNTCEGRRACDGAGRSGTFTILGQGSCLMDQSCLGVASASGATVTIGANSCVEGARACELLGSGGTVTVADDACHGVQACNLMGKQSSGSATVGQDSCYGQTACYEAGSFGSFSAGTNSCRGGNGSCKRVGSTVGHSFTVGNDSCNGSYSCHRMGDANMIPAIIEIGNNSCNTVDANGDLVPNNTYDSAACKDVLRDTTRTEAATLQIGSNSCNCESCCNCLQAGDVVPDNKCNTLEEGDDNCCTGVGGTTRSNSGIPEGTIGDSGGGGGEGSGPAPLEQKWNISEDASFEYSSLSFKLGYTVSDFISNADVRRKLDDTTYYPSSGMARFSVYDEGCKEDGVQILANGTSGIESIVEDDAEIDDAAGLGYSMDREVFVNITLDAEKISQNELLYSEDTSGFQVTAEIRFCVRFGLHTTSATSVEVNFLETLVTLNVDLTDGFEIGSIAVEPRDRLVRTANQVYLVIGYRCNAAGVQISTTAAINQGTVVKVCVKPDAEAEADGIHMRSIDDFSWSRVSPNVVNQPAIVGPNKIAANQLTSLDCDSGYEMCSFETILFAAFYTTPGAVLGSGVASMQFGSTDNTPNARRLRGETGEGRDLQEDDAAAAAEFELDFDVAQALPQGTSGAGSVSVVAAAMIFGTVVGALM